MLLYLKFKAMNTPDYIERNSRTIRLIGEDGLAKLAQSTVAIFGLGGVGSSCAEALVRGGVGNFLFIDKDDVEPSNLNRQALAFISTIGKPKTEVMTSMAKDINPDVNCTAIKEFVKSDNVAQIMEDAPHLDYIVDAIDTLSVKASVIEYANSISVPVVSAMGGANKTNPTLLEFADLSKTRVCPLCREMRKIARDRSIEQVDVLFSPETPIKVAAKEGAERSEKTELGTFSFFPPIMGQMIAGYVIRRLLGLG